MDWKPFSSFFQKLRSSSDPRNLLSQLLHGLVQMLKAGRGFVLLRDEKSGDLVPVISHKVPDTEEFARISTTVYKRALETQSVVFIEDADDDAAGEWLQNASLESLAVLPRSILCAPLGARGRVFGVIYLDGYLGRSNIDSSQIPFFETITGLASELIAAAQTRNYLLAAKGRLSAFNELVWRDQRLVLGDGPSAVELSEMIKAASAQNVNVLITGETGTGKEMVARALHRLSSRQNEPFVPVNCAALPRDIIEAELFGAEEGAFTGAKERRIGRFELASSGTLFLDEIGELPEDIQVKLLRVLQERTITRLGGAKPISLDFRLICATNAEIEDAVRQARFRQDLYYRINVFRIHLKPLRERREDVKPLAEHFLEVFTTRFGKQISGFSQEAESSILSYPWPGNIRELRNAVERAVVVERSGLIQSESLPISRQTQAIARENDLMDRFLSSLPGNYEEAKEIFERAFLVKSFKKNDGNIAAVARETGIPRNTLYRRLERLGLRSK